MMKKTGVFLLFLALSGCVAHGELSPSPGASGVQAQAIAAYDRGVVYMGQGRYLLAREQFLESASMAVTPDLYNDATGGVNRVDTLLQNRRQYHE